MTSAPTTQTLRLTHQVSASPARVFAAFTDPAELVKWWAPEGWSVPEVSIDLSVGGTFRWGLLDDEGETVVATGQFVEIDAPNKLVQTWAWEGQEEETRLTLTFREQGGGTQIELLHEGFAAKEMADKHEQGWTGCLRRLGEEIS